MSATPKLQPSPLSSEEIKEALADALVLVNHFLVLCNDAETLPIIFESYKPATVDDYLRRIQGHLLEAYREECQVPWSRFYERTQQKGKKAYPHGS